MAKTISVRTTTYSVSANVVVKDEAGLYIDEFERDGFFTKSERALKKLIEKSYENDTVIAITDIIANKNTTTVKYKINASAGEIIEACRHANLDISVVGSDSVADEDTEDDAKDDAE